MTKQELIRYNSFLLTQMELTQRRVIKPIYRGDSLSNLCHRLNIKFEENSTNITELLRRLFMVGEKAKRYLVFDENFSIDDIDNYVFKKIFKYFEDSLRSKNSNTVYFFKRNSFLKDFFSEKSNKKRFIEIVSNASENEKIQIRNFYLILLHQLAAINYKTKSHLVSTTKDYKIAELFANQNRDANRLILHCWQPIQKELQIIRKYNLPNYYVGPFYYQKELSILGGILPHFISGIELKLTNKFYPNPYIFKNEISEETFLNGLKIDQGNFDNILRLTNYKRSLITDGEKIWERTNR